jgi:signal transduction histidine kinase
VGDDERVKGIWDDQDQRSYIHLPLKSKGLVVGTIGLVTRAGQLLTDREVGVLKAVGHEIGTAIDNALLLAETRRREQETVALNHLLVRISSSLEMDQVLDAIAEGARQLLDAEIGAVGVVDEGQRHISVRAVAGSRTDIFRGLAIPLNKMIFDAASFSEQPIYVGQWGLDLPIPRISELIDQEGIVSSLAVPMWYNGRLHGFVGILTRQHRRFAKQDTQLFVRLVMQVVVAIENADLYRQVRNIATLEERDRLAREMHDNLAQSLAYMNIKTALTDDLLSTNQIPQARSNLLELKQIVKEAYADVRESIFSLRTPMASRWGLVPTLQDYLVEYQAHHLIDTQLIVEDESLTRFPAEVEVQVNRIIHEALTNVHKHSGASKAWIRFGRDDRHIRICIEDNGQGFDPAQLEENGSQHFGLQIMRERAESVGGELDISSQIESGTRILLRVPIQYADWRSP